MGIPLVYAKKSYCIWQNSKPLLGIFLYFFFFMHVSRFCFFDFPTAATITLLLHDNYAEIGTASNLTRVRLQDIRFDRIAGVSCVRITIIVPKTRKPKHIFWSENVIWSCLSKRNPVKIENPTSGKPSGLRLGVLRQKIWTRVNRVRTRIKRSIQSVVG